MIRIGYTTGTFDSCHIGQLRFLQACRTLLPYGSKLIVGLTTDELAEKQKRKPKMSYEHRRTLLLALRGLVDDVLPHSGDDKIIAWKKIRFTDVFIGDEYFGTPEYSALQSVGIPVHFIPRHPHDHLSSSELSVQATREIAKKLTIIGMSGPGGPIMMLADQPESVVIKTLRVSERESQGIRTANVYELPVPNPRNMKKLGEVHKFPNLPGVNAYRELDIQAVIKGANWNPVFDSALIRREDREMPMHKVNSEDWSHLNRDKDQPREIYFMYQRWAGQTLAAWILENEKEIGFIQVLQRIIYQVQWICEDLANFFVVHGDLHAFNVCVQKVKPKGPQPVVLSHDDVYSAPLQDVQVSIIDFGWCLHRSFAMDAGERAYYEKCLQDCWDWKHFCDAMEYEYHDAAWFSQLDFTGV